jgi:hypothetical protein
MLFYAMLMSAVITFIFPMIWNAFFINWFSNQWWIYHKGAWLTDQIPMVMFGVSLIPSICMIWIGNKILGVFLAASNERKYQQKQGRWTNNAASFNDNMYDR